MVKYDYKVDELEEFKNNRPIVQNKDTLLENA